VNVCAQAPERVVAEAAAAAASLARLKCKTPPQQSLCSSETFAERLLTSVWTRCALASYLLASAGICPSWDRVAIQHVRSAALHTRLQHPSMIWYHSCLVAHPPGRESRGSMLSATAQKRTATIPTTPIRGESLREMRRGSCWRLDSTVTLHASWLVPAASLASHIQMEASSARW